MGEGKTKRGITGKPGSTRDPIRRFVSTDRFVPEVASMDPCVTCTDATRAFYVQHELCPEVCERMRRIRVRLGLPVEGMPLPPAGDAAPRFVPRGSFRLPWPLRRGESPEGPEGSPKEMQRCEAMIPGSRR